MIDFQIRTNVDELKRRLTDLEKNEVPFATARALTDVAFLVRAAEQDEMRRVFKNPTDWTLNGMVVDKAEKSGKPAAVRFEEFAGKGTPSGRYLQPQIHGGPRGHTPFEHRLQRAGYLKPGEFLVPARHADRNGRGDLNPGQITKILSDLSTIDTALRGAGGRNRGVRRRESYRFEKGGGPLPRGIYHGTGLRRGLVFLVVRQPMYVTIFDFKGVAERTIAREFAPAFRRNLARAVQSSRYNPANMSLVA